MKSRQLLRLGLIRFAIVLGISAVLVVIMGEVAHDLFGSQEDRLPTTIELVIPKGTAEKVDKGEEVPSIPESMVFMLGDTLVVKNEDVVDHQLGPIWVPAGASGSILMDNANSYDYTCSFRPTRYLGLDIREPTTLSVRLIALGYVAPATALFLFVYSLVLFPLNKKTPENQIDLDV